MSIALRRLALSIAASARDPARNVVVVHGLRPGAGASTLTTLAAAALNDDGIAVHVLDRSSMLTDGPPEGFTLIDAGAILDGRGPTVQERWRPRIAGVVVVMRANVDTWADANEARALLDVLELPLIGFAWREQTERGLNETMRRRVGVVAQWGRTLRAWLARQLLQPTSTTTTASKVVP